MNKVQEIRERVEKATPGLWKFSNSSDIRGNKGELRAPFPHNGFMLVSTWVNDEDIAFVSKAREDIPWLLERVAALEAENSVLVTKNDRLLADNARLQEINEKLRDDVMNSTNAYIDMNTHEREKRELKAENARLVAERDAAIDDMLSYASSGITNFAPYCANRTPKYVCSRGWCNHGPECRGVAWKYSGGGKE